MRYFKSLIVVLIGLFMAGASASRSGTANATAPKLQTGTTQRIDNKNYASIEDADSPADLSPTGWKLVLLRTKQALKDKQLGTQAAALGYYATLSFFPALLGAATVYATFASPQGLMDVIDGLQGIIPPAIYDLIDQQLSPLSRAERGSIGIAAIISVAALLWTTSGGLQNLIKSTNVAYDAEESRGFIKLRLLSVVLSVALLLLGATILILLLLQKEALTKLGFPDGIATVFPFLRWPILIVLISVALSIIYRYAPDRRAPKWSWVSWGATTATIIWLIGTGLFFYYAQNFGNFNKTYGIFAGIIVLMTWFNLTALIILVGAQVNKKLEEVTDADTVDR